MGESQNFKGDENQAASGSDVEEAEDDVEYVDDEVIEQMNQIAEEELVDGDDEEEAQGEAGAVEEQQQDLDSHSWEDEDGGQGVVEEVSAVVEAEAENDGIDLKGGFKLHSKSAFCIAEIPTNQEPSTSGKNGEDMLHEKPYNLAFISGDQDHRCRAWAVNLLKRPLDHPAEESKGASV